MRGTQKEPKQIDFRTLLNAYSKEFGDIIKFSITHSDSLFKLLPSFLYNAVFHVLPKE